MLFAEIKESLEELKNENRFHKFEGENFLWFNDSYTQGLYSADSNVIDEIQNAEEDTEFKKLSIEQGLKLLGLCRVINNSEENIIEALLPESKCSIMINTSNRCNLSCSYCYRNKNKASVISFDTVKKALKFAMTEYKPHASEYVISYSMTSESSIDLDLLKKIADEYINYENYKFNDSDISNQNFDKFYKKLRKDLENKLKIPFPNRNRAAMIEYLNSLLELRNLFEILDLTEGMFNENDRNEIRRRKYIAKWRLYRLNRWCLDLLYEEYIPKRRVPYVTFWFMTNGTCASKEFIDFVKSCDINPLWISIDGPKEVHDSNRVYNQGNGSYEDIIKNIRSFRRSGLNLKASSVLTSNYPKPLEIIKHLKKLGFSEISMTPVRPGFKVSFSEQNVSELLKGYDEVFDELKKCALKKDFSLYRMLKEDMTLAAFNSFASRIKLVRRCSFDDQLVIDSTGDIYPCLYFTGNSNFCYGNVDEGIDSTRINHQITVINRGECADCWARNLCGGTCFYGSYKTTGSCFGTDKIECQIRKHLAEQGLKLLIFMREHNINLSLIY